MTNLKLYNYRNVWLNALASSSRRRASRCFCFARVALVSGQAWPGLDSSSSSEDLSTGRNMSALLARLGGLTCVCTRPQDKGIPGGSRWSTRLSRSRCSVIFLQVFSCSWGLQSAVAQLDRCYHRTISWVAPCPLKTSDAKDPDRIAGFCEDRWLKILSLKRCWKQLTQRNLTE